MKTKRSIIGQRLAELRCERGLTQEDLAAEVGVSTRTVGNIEREESVPTLAIIVGIADFFEVSVDFLIGRGDVA